MDEEQKRMKKLIIIVAIVTIIILGIFAIFIIKDHIHAPYDKPKIPDGFYYVTGEWNTGYVISDNELDENNVEGNNGNQFVWIPVRDIKKFQRTTAFNDSIVKPDEGYSEPDNNDSAYNAMLDSVKKYGGFYVGRYEAGDAEATEARTKPTEAHQVAVRKEQVVYNYVRYGNGEAGAVDLARSMYKDSSSVNSTLIYGIQWDAIMNFVKEDVNLNNSNSWGNFKDSTGYAGENCGALQKTGTNEFWKAKNIYDLAGNVGEWTMETNLEKMKVIRGRSI